MAASSGSLETSANSNSQPPQSTPFSFSTTGSFMTTSFTDLLASSDDNYPPTGRASASSALKRSLGDRIAERTGSGVPKFKSFPPPSLPLSPPPVSPSSYFAIPPGLSPAELLDSPVLLCSSNILPSPTTGTFPFQAFNWKSNSNQQDIKLEHNNSSDFSFQTQTNPIQKGPAKQEGAALQSEMNSNGFQSSDNNNQSNKSSNDGYNWRKYGQKQVKNSENPRSYYKCTHPNCPTKKKVEKSLDGQITEIVYKGTHNHPKPQSTRRSSSSSTLTSASSVPVQFYNTRTNEISEVSYGLNGTGQMDSVATPENSSISVVDDDFEHSSDQKSKSGGGDHEFDEDEPQPKRWKMENESEGISAAGGGSSTVREPRVVVQTISDIDILDDGYRWRKYGQKVVKGNPNPRSYYKCTSQGCPVRKHVERASQDPRAVITTYEGKHNHNVPAARGSGNALNRPVPNHLNNNTTMTMRPSMPRPSNYQMSMRGSAPLAQAPHTLEMLQNPASYGFSGYGNSMNSTFARAKEESRDELFLESLLC